MENFKIGDKVVFKKEVLDEISKTDCVKSRMGTSLRKRYYEHLIANTCFKTLGYFNVMNVNSGNIYVGLYIGADLFKLYQEEYLYKESDLTTTKNYQNNEIRFQKPKASCKRGVVPAGRTISGRKDKIAISIGHLSYQVCNC